MTYIFAEESFGGGRRVAATASDVRRALRLCRIVRRVKTALSDVRWYGSTMRERTRSLGGCQEGRRVLWLCEADAELGRLPRMCVEGLAHAVCFVCFGGAYFCLGPFHGNSWPSRLLQAL